MAIERIQIYEWESFGNLLLATLHVSSERIPDELQGRPCCSNPIQISKQRSVSWAELSTSGSRGMAQGDQGCGDRAGVPMEIPRMGDQVWEQEQNWARPTDRPRNLITRNPESPGVLGLGSLAPRRTTHCPTGKAGS